MEVKLYVGNLADGTTEADLRNLFAQAGNVTSVELIKPPANEQSQGFAFVSMSTQPEARKAISMFHGFSLAYRRLKVRAAKPGRMPGSFQTRLSAFGAAHPGSKTIAPPARPARGGYQSRLSAFGAGNPTPKPRRRGGSQRY